MRKYISILAALIIGCASAFSQLPFTVKVASESGETETDRYGNVYPILNLGDEIPSGSEVYCYNFDTNALGWMGEGCGEYLLRVALSGITDERTSIIGEMDPTDLPSWGEYQNQGATVWGYPGLCIFKLTCYGQGSDNFGQTTNSPGLWLKVPAEGNGSLVYEIHDRFMTKRPVPYEARFIMKTFVVDAQGETTLAHWFTVVFRDTPSGIQSVETSDPENVTYYNLSGQPVANPEHGVFIRRTSDGKTSKILLK